MSNGEIRNPVEELAEEFMQQRRNGKSPSIEEYARNYPQHADEIRDLFPTLEMMEHVRRDVVEHVTIESTPSTEIGQTLGDFQILREIGRGGMGVVYEAQQISLGRRVALKILAPNLQRKAKYLERFKREAKAAANLQHSNIVPVYGVAEENGQHFYVMQFVFGRGLDEVFDALRRNNDGEPSNDHSISADGLANALATGQFCSHHSEVGKQLRDQQLAADVETAKQELSKTRPPSSSTDLSYCRRIAELGQQAADALAYAHRNGILHRDIKPGNLLLDVFGNVWITDFGLVKMTGEEALTETGDIVGTLRYIAPECLKGQFDERSDVYGLGLTLHEMLAREKAFSAISRGELTQQILEQGPSRLIHVPRDLSTIVRKATALEPANRYQDAADLADDLGRFLGSQPIRARRATAAERLWSWSKRNRRLAASLATCWLLLVSGLMLSLMFTYRLNDYAKDRQDAFVAAKKESDQAKRRLVETSIARAKALAASQTPGQRLTGLESIRESVAVARELQMDADTIDELRTAAISCLANVDIVKIKEWESNAGIESDVAFNTQLDTYVVQPTNFGPIEIRKTSDQSIITKIDGKKYWGQKWISPDGRFINVMTSWRNGSRNHIYEVATGRLVHDLDPQRILNRSNFQFNRASDKAALASADGFVRVYSIGDLEPVFEIRANADSLLFGEPDQLFVFRRKLNSPAALFDSIFKNPKADPWQRLSQIVSAALDTKVESVAEVYSIATGELQQTFKLAGDTTHSAAWGADGLVAVVSNVNRERSSTYAETITNRKRIIELFQRPYDKPLVRLTKEVDATQDVAFDESGRVLAVNLHNKFAIYEVRTGNCLMIGPGAPKATDGSRLVCDRSGKFCIYEFVLSDTYRGLVAKKTHNGTCIDPMEEFIVSPDADAMRFFDLRTGEQIGQIDEYPCGYARLTPDGQNLFVIRRPADGSLRELHRWPIQRDEKHLAIGPPSVFEIAPDFQPHHLAMDKFGKVVASEDNGRSKIGIRFLNEERAPIVIDGPNPQTNSLMFVDISNDVRWAATGTWHGDGCAIYDIESGKVVHKVTTGRSSVRFTSDNRYLICGSGRAVELGTWNEFQLDTIGDPMRFLFGFEQPENADFAFAAILGPFGRLVVLNATDFSTLASIEIHSRSTASLSSVSKDGRILIVDQYDNEKEYLSLLDVGKLREKLKSLDLDWDSAELPAASGSQIRRELVLIGPKGE